jgi:mono/diheme cytochrome c family protein
MPPSASGPSSAEIATLQSWVNNNYPTGTCGVASNGGASGGGGSTGSGGAGGASGGSGGSSQTGPGGTGGGLPCAIQTFLVNNCDSCHGTTPSGGAPRSLVTYANLTSQDPSSTSMTEAQVALQRIQSTTSPMPPAPATAATSAEISTLQNWINAGYPSGSCGGDAGPPPSDPLNASPTCTSSTTWTRGTSGSSSMEPGQGCISCHSKSGEAPKFVIAGTLFPTGHEPDNCDGVNGTSGARVVVTGNDGTIVTLTPNSVGNFYSTTTLPPPYQAKVVNASGVERVMSATASTGDCNSCHTQSGANGAPGRVTLPI